MPVIRNLSIKLFKGIQAVQVNSCGSVNILVGKNNAGKSSILHAIDMGGLALGVGRWNAFQPKLAIKDMFWSAGPFEIEFELYSTMKLSVQNSATNLEAPEIKNRLPPGQVFKTLLIQAEGHGSLSERTHKTPSAIMQQIENRNFGAINSLDILFAVKFYAEKNERSLTLESYNSLIEEIQRYFPDLSAVSVGRTETDIATLNYEEFGKTLDILYSGSGLKRFIDILVKVAITKANIVLIDEPESGLHPDLQRRFFQYLLNLAETKGIQFFISTHSHIIFNLQEELNFYRVTNLKGHREVHVVDRDARHTLLGDFGIRPSDVFNSDICLMVEGATDVIFFEHILRVLYAEEFEPVSATVIQYGGGAAHGIVAGSIDVSNIIPAKRFTFWVHDRDKTPSSQPSTAATKFKNQIEKQGLPVHILRKREIEYYFPREVIIAAQNGDRDMEHAAIAILNGDQTMKFKTAAERGKVCIPKGRNLRKLLQQYLVEKSQLDSEIREIVEGTLLEWRNQLIG